MKNKENGNTKSLFLYTALIFVVALLLILISFFGDSNLEKSINANIPTPPPVATEAPNRITERSAKLSQENMILTKENQQLKNSNEEFKKQIQTYQNLLSAKVLKSEGNKEAALEILSKINVETLDNDQKAMYNEIKE